MHDEKHPKFYLMRLMMIILLFVCVGQVLNGKDMSIKYPQPNSMLIRFHVF